MTYPDYIREKAVALRRKGLTLDEITERLALPKTTIYYWIRDIPIERKHNRPPAKESQKLGTERMQAKYAQLRAEAHDTYLRARLEAWMQLVKTAWLDSIATGRGAAW